MIGHINNAIVTVIWDLNFERLYSPDGSHHLLPCSVCGVVEWVLPPVCSVICSTCANNMDHPDDAPITYCPECQMSSLYGHLEACSRKEKSHA